MSTVAVCDRSCEHYCRGLPASRPCSDTASSAQSSLWLFPFTFLPKAAGDRTPFAKVSPEWEPQPQQLSEDSDPMKSRTSQSFAFLLCLTGRKELVNFGHWLMRYLERTSITLLKTLV